jgi:Zn-dependent protease
MEIATIMSIIINTKTVFLFNAIPNLVLDGSRSKSVFVKVS